MVTEVLANAAQRWLLSGSINASVTTITLSSNTGFPTTYNTRIRVDDELMLVTASAGGASYTVTRGIEGTTAASHAGGVAVRLVLSAGGLAQWAVENTSQPDERIPRDGTCLLGFYTLTSSAGTAFETLVGKKHASRYITVDWDPVASGGSPWSAQRTAAESHGWSFAANWGFENFDNTSGTFVEGIRPDQVVSGTGDQQIVNAAAAMAGCTLPSMLRLCSEMNGYWHSYCSRNQAGTSRGANYTPATFQAAWRRIWCIFQGSTKKEVNARLADIGQAGLTVTPSEPFGAPKTQFVFAPNSEANPSASDNTNVATEYYPGDRYVDWSTVDMYDDVAGNTDWASTRLAVLTGHYNRAPAKPFGFSETGLLSGADDPQWVTDVFNWVEAHPRCKLVTWYNSGAGDLNSKTSTKAAYITRIANSRYLSDYKLVVTDGSRAIAKLEDGQLLPAKLQGGSTGQVVTSTSGGVAWQTPPTADPAMGGDLSGTASNAQLIAGAVGTTELASGAVTNAKIGSGAVQDTNVAAANKDGTAGTASMRTLGTGAQQAAAGNDARFAAAQLLGNDTPLPLRTNPFTGQSMITTFASGHGWTTSGFASANLNDTSDFALGSQHLSAVTGGTGAFMTIDKNPLTSLNMTGRMFRIWVKVDSQVSFVGTPAFTFYAGDSTFTNYDAWPVSTGPGYNRILQPDEWTPITFSYADKTTSGSSPRTAYTRLRIVPTDNNTGHAITYRFGGIASVPESSVWPNGVVSLTFDDCFLTHYTVAAPDMDAYGFQGTEYPILDQLGTSNHMSTTQMQFLQNVKGWEVACHSATQADHDTANAFPAMSTSAVEANIRTMRDYLHQNGFGGSGAYHLAYPQGANTGALNPVISKYFTAARGTVGVPPTEVPNPAMPYRLRCMSVLDTTSTASIQTMIDNAYTNKAWLILLFHEVVGTTFGPAQYSRANFNTILAYLNTKTIPVRTVGDVLRLS